MSHFYVTTPIYYVNDLPHIGHIYTTVVADTIARYRRLAGDRVRFLTGTDEHGQKIEDAARERGIEPLALADEVVARYPGLWREWTITHDDFIRTTEQRHAAGVAAIIERIAASGDFYVSRHEGLYCLSCETYYTEKELLGEDNLCPIHERPTELRSEENVFFRLSKYQDALLEWYDRPGSVRPASRANEVRQFVAAGLRDLSVSRTTLKWGLPFPGYEGHVTYVWLDALTNYISALGYGQDERHLYDEFWGGGGERVHLVGKDILRHHAVYWPAFLLSAGLPLPTTVYAHGWWLRDDRKISKSAGGVVRPDDLASRFGTDSLRYFLLRDMSFGQDARFSDEAVVDRYNSDLANDLGNTVSRLAALAGRAFGNRTPPVATDHEGLGDVAESAVAEYRRAMDDFAFHKALEALWKLLAETSQYLVRREPWKHLKDPAARDEVGTILWNGLEAVRIVATALLPFMPRKAPEVLAAIGVSPPSSLEALAWGGLPGGAAFAKTPALFPRVDKDKFLGKTAAAPAAKPKKAAEKSKTATIDQFFEIELKVATVISAEAVAKSEKLLQLQVDVGEGEPRTLVAGIAAAYDPADLAGRQVVIVANLEPAKLMGIESNGMVLAASEGGKPILLRPDAPVPGGTRVK